MIEKMRIEHVKEVAKIHATSWSNYEISVKLGEEFLNRCFYSSIVNSHIAFGYVYIDNGKVIGYATGFYKYEEFNRSTLRKNFFYLITLLLKRLLTRRMKVVDLLNMLRDNRKLRKLQFPEHQLGALALSNEHKGTAKGTEIMIATIESVLADLESRGCRGCWGVCDERNKPMQILFLSLGFKQVDTVSFTSKVVTLFEKVL